MRALPYRKINAFTSDTSLGNPAAYFLLKHSALTNEQMLAIGREHAGFVSELVFASDSDKADCKLTYYSSECEVDFCGHGTIATMYDLLSREPSLASKPEVQIETNRKGVLTVYNRLAKEDAVYICAPEARYLNVPVDAAAVARALCIQKEALDIRLPIDCIDAGLRTLIVPMMDLAQEIDAWPGQAALKRFCESNGLDIILIFCRQVSDAGCMAHTRVFAPRFGYLEDPATGSGNSAFAYYLLKNNLWDGLAASVEQGGSDRAYNPVRLCVKDGRVLFGGRATVVIDGTYYLQEA